MPDFQFNSFPINATPLADVSENTNADGVLVVRNGAVQKVPKASAAHAIGALDSTDLEPYVKKEQTVNNYPLNGDVVIQAVDVPFTPSAGIESDNVQNAIVEAVGLMSEAHEDTIYTNAGTSSPIGGYTLAEDVSGYQYLDIYCHFSGRTEVKRIPVSDGTSYELRFMNLADSDSSTFLSFSEIGVSFSGTTMTVTHNKCENWSGNVDSNPVIASSGKPYILKVMGIKYDLIGTQGGTIVVDNALSPNSTNPVQNKVIYDALGNAGLSNAAKIALLNCFANVAWIGDDGQQYYDALYDALYPETPPAQLVGITAVFDQTGVTIYDNDSLDDLKQYLTVTATYDDSTTEEVTNYVLSGTLTAGTSTITVSYGGEDATFSVVVTERHSYVYPTDADVLKVSAALDATYGLSYNHSTLQQGRRRVFASSSVAPKEIVNSGAEGSTDLGYPIYPFKVPQDATSLTCAITPSTQYIAVNWYTYDESTDAYVKVADSGWQQGTYTKSITAGEMEYVAVVTKYNSTGTSYPTEPSGFSITFV